MKFDSYLGVYFFWYSLILITVLVDCLLWNYCIPIRFYLSSCWMLFVMQVGGILLSFCWCFEALFNYLDVVDLLRF